MKDWTDEDERALKAFRRAYEDDALTPWRTMQRWRMSCWVFAFVAIAEAVVICAVLTGWWKP